jgi:Uncharacterised protein family (UPF0158)
MTTHARRTKPSCPAQHCPVENRADQPQVAANSAAFAVGQQSIGDYPELVFDLDHVDLGEIATALQDQGGYEHRWLINPDTGEIAFWTEDTGIDGHSPIDLNALDLIAIDPLPSYVWYQDMADFAEGISDERAGRRLARTIDGRGAFRRFKAELHEEYPDLLPAWYAFRQARAMRRAVEWLVDNNLIDGETANRYFADHADPDLP